MSTLDETTAAIEAVAKVILNLTASPIDTRTKLERVAYAAAVLKREADAGLDQLNPLTEVSHG
jgi:hypothetical protein